MKIKQQSFITSLLIFSLLFVVLVPDLSLAQTMTRKKSGAEVFQKWITIGAVVAGGALGVATLGVAGLIVGPLAGAAIATAVGVLMQGNPVDQWRAVFNKEPKYGNANIVGAIKQEQWSKDSSVRPGATISPQEAQDAYNKAYETYKEAVEAGDQSDIAAKAAAVRKAKEELNAATR